MRILASTAVFDKKQCTCRAQNGAAHCIVRRCAINVEKAGFTPTEVALTTKMNPWMWGNILLTSPLSTSIDTSTGASREYDPGEYMIDLQPAAN